MISIHKIIRLILAFTIITSSFLQCENEVVKVKEDKEVPILEVDPTITELSGIHATIFWTTNEPCSVNVYYGLDASTDTLILTGREYRQNHTMTITDLSPNSNYYYFTSSIDVAGNTTSTAPVSYTTPGDTVNFIQYGWSAFEDGSFPDAVIYFKDFLSMNPAHTEALTGSGWSFTFIDSFRTAANQFSLALDTDNEYLDAISGQSLAFYLDSNYTGCINSVELLNTLDNSYIFTHDSTFDYTDIQLMLLDSYVQSTLIDEACNLLLDYNGYYLNPDDTLWMVEDSTYDDIDDALHHTVGLIKADIWSDGFP